MIKYSSPFWNDYCSREDLKKYGVNGLLLFALQLRFGIEDVDVLATTSITEGGDDKKADLIYIDSEEKRIIIAQTTLTDNQYDKNGHLKKEASRNKASDLNTAIAWIFSRPIDQVPIRIRTHSEEIRRIVQ